MLEVFGEDGLGELLILLRSSVRNHVSPAGVDGVPPRPRSYHRLRSIALRSCTRGLRASCKAFDQHLSTLVPKQQCPGSYMPTCRACEPARRISYISSG